MKKFILKIWPFVTIIFIVSIFFYPVWLQGKIPLPGDFVVGTYYPWLDYKWGYPAGVPVKNPITTDVVSFIYPMRTYAVELIKQGNLPLWNPLILSGTPLLANFQSAPLSITNIFYFLTDTLTAWSLQVIFQPILASIFLYLLLREFGRSKLASVSGGLFFAFAGFSMIWMEWNAHSLVAAFFPLIFFLSLKWLKSGKLRWGILFSVAFVLHIFAGYPQIILYELLSLLVLVIMFDPKFRNKKRFFGLVFFGFLGVGLAAVQVIPSFELIKLSQRGVEDVINVSAFLPWQMIITIVAPDYFGNHSTGNWWGSGDYTLVTGYSGVVTVILASIGIISSLRERYVKFGITLVAISFAIVFENPVSSFIRDSGFLSLQASSAHRALILSNLGIAFLAAFGIDRILNRDLKFRELLRSLYPPGILLLGFFISTLFIVLNDDTPLTDSTNFRVGLRNLILPSVVFIFSASLIFFSFRFKKYSRFFTCLLILLSIFELFRFGWKFTPFSERELVFPKTPVLEFLQKQDTPFRTAAEEAIPINMMMPYGIQTIEGYDAVYPLTYAKYLSALNSGGSDADPMGRYGSVDNLNSPLLNLANVKYILALKKDRNGKLDTSGEIISKFQQDNLIKVFEDKSVVILENTKALDRAKMFYEFEQIEDDKLILNKLLDKAFPVTEKLILEKSLGMEFEKGINKVNFQEKPNLKMIKVETEKPGILFIGDSLYPGWNAYVDGKKIGILKADFNFMAIPVTSGNHEILVKYEPESFRVGSILSMVSLTILILTAFSFKIRKWITTNH